MTSMHTTTVVSELETQRALLCALTDRMRVVGSYVPAVPKEWAGMANDVYRHRRNELDASLHEAVAELDRARDLTDRAIATLGSRVG